MSGENGKMGPPVDGENASRWQRFSLDGEDSKIGPAVDGSK